MKDNFSRSLQLVLADEGGFVMNPHDPGGMTNLGVTKKTWEEWVGHPVSEQDMRGLTPEAVRPLYFAWYWNRIAGDQLPAGVDYCVFDTAVNSGPGRAARWLQSISKVAVDGLIGPKTIAAIPPNVIDLYCDVRQNYLQTLPTFKTFGKGWTKRVSNVRLAAKEMYGH